MVAVVTRSLLAYCVLVVAIAVLLPIASVNGAPAWMHPGFARHLVAAAIVAGLLLLFIRPLYRTCGAVARWLLSEPADRSRWVTVGVVLLILTSYLWQTHIMIAHRGVPGWVYNGMPPVIADKIAVAATPAQGIDLRPFRAAFRKEPLSYLRRSGYASGELMFLHFRDGKMLPANLGLAMVSWPRSTFGLDGQGVRHGGAFLDLIRHMLDVRRAGRQFLLPPGLSYPPHLSYQVIDYSAYPPGAELVGVSFWNVVAQITNGGIDVLSVDLITKEGAF